MLHRLVFTRPEDGLSRDLGEKVYFDNLPVGYPVYLFYYPGPIRNDDLETRLKSFGKEAEKNLFVNIGSIGDPQYRKIVTDFGIRKRPAIILTAIDKLASIQYGKYYSTAYVRLENNELLRDAEKTINSIDKLFNLFISGRVLEALKQGKHDEFDAVVSHFRGIVINVLSEIWKTLKEKDIAISLVEGKFELKQSIGKAPG